ncbi:DUF1837 domain-containing protein [Paenibacillus illinoisensis]|uniref:HamA C-terminal domain-containing protein n=1 Tax=Paenibacillus illinoisensis TaxID=59845 RepID=UPI0030184C10
MTSNSTQNYGVEHLLTHTESFMNHVHIFNQSFNLLPDKNHFGTCINYVDMQEFREEFLEELVNTICEWVYSDEKSKSIINDVFIKEENRTVQNAQSKLRKIALKYFRDRDDRDLNLQGQFGELLLFNFVQHFFRAVPLLRKMPITTSTGHERFGSDAIHYKYENEKNLIFLGESKIYTRNYRFRQAFENSVTSIISTYASHRKELGLYTYDDFLDKQLVDIARQYKRGVLKNTEIHMVCLVGYNETGHIDGDSEDAIKANIERVLIDKCNNLDKSFFDGVTLPLLNRISYILFPVWELDKLVESFQSEIR